MAIFSQEVLTSRVGILRLFQILFTCIAFSLAAHRGGYAFDYGDYCMITWCGCFVATLLVLLVEGFQISGRFPISWGDLTATVAALATLMTLAASILYPVYSLQRACHYESCKEIRGYRIGSTVASCLAFMAYAAEVAASKPRPGEVRAYMTTIPGFLKVMETFIAGIIFAVLAERPYLYERYNALQWCVAVYAICFILSAVAILLAVGACTGRLCVPFDRYLSMCNLFSVLAYITATIIWPVYCFHKKYGTPQRPSQCHRVGICNWDQQMVVAVLTAVNLITYIADLIHSGRLVFVRQ
uniref:myeloid-associated differentiation marker n=1 Tax=Myxine glutinosa TaxID=7769 RepID=UPI00358F6272